MEFRSSSFPAPAKGKTNLDMEFWKRESANTYLNPTGYDEVIQGLKDRLGITATKVQIKNKWGKLKEDYKKWRKLMLKQTGTVWCPIKHIILMNDEWWKKAAVDIPGCGKFKKMGLQNEDELQKYFGDIVNVGDTQEVENGLTQDEVAGEDEGTNEVDQVSHVNANGKRPPRVVQDKGKKAKTGTSLLIQEAVTSMVTSATSYVENKAGKYSIEKVMEDMSDGGNDRSSDDGDQFFHIINSGAKLANIYSELYLNNAATRTLIQTGMGWLNETLNTPGECHKMLRMNTEIFLDLHDVLVERYGMQPSKHMSSYEMLEMFLWTVAGCESNRKTQNRFKHSGETVSRKFHEVLECVIAMAKDYLRPTDPNFHTVHMRILNDKRAYPHFKDCIGAVDGTHARVSLSP
uniref:Uncharacterized protein n=1 Tax=Oryza brachyantha TaxID=4533 RepID=J3MJI6_ORYBR